MLWPLIFGAPPIGILPDAPRFFWDSVAILLRFFWDSFEILLRFFWDSFEAIEDRRAGFFGILEHVLTLRILSNYLTGFFRIPGNSSRDSFQLFGEILQDALRFFRILWHVLTLRILSDCLTGFFRILQDSSGFLKILSDSFHYLTGFLEIFPDSLTCSDSEDSFR